MTQWNPPITADEAAELVRFATSVEQLRQLEYEQMMRSQRKFAARNRARINAEWDALNDNPMTISAHISAARAEMGEARWKELNEGFEQ